MASFANSGNIEVKAGATLTLDGDTLDNTSGTITVDAGTLATPTAGLLTVTSTTISNGALDNNGTLDLTGGVLIQTGALANTGQINVTGTGNAIDNETAAAFSNTGNIEVEAGAQLTLSGDTLNNTSGTITVDAGRGGAG